MEGRLKCLLASGILFSVMGCGFLRDKKPGSPFPTNEPPVASQKPVERKWGKDNEPLKVETLVALGNVRVESAANADRSMAEREDLQNQARQVFQEVLRRDPKNLDAMLGMARISQTAQDKAKCLEWYHRAAKTYPKNGEIWIEMGTAMSVAFKDRNEAIHCFHAATKIDPENRAYRKKLGFTLALAERYEESYAWLSRAMPEAEAHYNLAGVMDHNGQHDLAKQEFILALKADPGHEKSKQALAYYAKPHETPGLGNPVQAVNHEQWSMVPITRPEANTSLKQAADSPPNPPSASQPPQPMTKIVNGTGSNVPNLSSTSGWDR